MYQLNPTTGAGMLDISQHEVECNIKGILLVQVEANWLLYIPQSFYSFDVLTQLGQDIQIISSLHKLICLCGVYITQLFLPVTLHSTQHMYMTHPMLDKELWKFAMATIIQFNSLNKLTCLVKLPLHLHHICSSNRCQKIEMKRYTYNTNKLNTA